MYMYIRVYLIFLCILEMKFPRLGLLQLTSTVVKLLNLMF